MESGSDSRKLHAVIVPFPAQGHVTPSLQLAKKLVANHGFRITFVNTTHIHARFMKSRSATPKQPLEFEGIEFVAVSDGLPEDHLRLRDLTAYMKVVLFQMGPAFEDLVANLLKKSPITCIIRDKNIFALHNVGKKLDVPVVVFATSSAVSLHCTYHLNTFISARILPLPPPPDASTPTMNASTLTVALPQSAAEAAARASPVTCLPGGSPTMRVEDIPTTLLSHDLENFFVRLYLDHQNPVLPETDGVLFNSNMDMEGEVLNAMRGSMNENIFAVGPLALDAKDGDEVEEVTMAGVGSGLWEEDRVSISWLDGQKPSSVLFVSFGSIATVSVQQMREFTAGLETSNVAFLWVVRPDLIDEMSENEEYKSMFAEFTKRTEKRALMVPWAPQPAVLSHPAVGAFLTHCGWNSIVESTCSGVPMLGWPRLADQNTNCHYVTSVWKVGLELLQSRADDGTPIVSEEEIVQKVTKIMCIDELNEEVAEIRRNCRNKQMAARKAVVKGGPSEAAFVQFVELVTTQAQSRDLL